MQSKTTRIYSIRSFLIYTKPANELGANLALWSPIIRCGGIVVGVVIHLARTAKGESTFRGGLQQSAFGFAQLSKLSTSKALKIICAAS